MKKYHISARGIDLYHEEIKAESEREALAILRKKLEAGNMPIADQWIEGEDVEEVNS